MKLRKDKWGRIQIGIIVSELRNMSSNPIQAGYNKYVGFEHIKPQNLNLNQFGNLSDGITFKKIFSKGDVLFGKIRAYLKKVAIAPIDGICSGDILVLRTKNSKKLSQELLPYFLTTDSFLKIAIDSSIGTTLPRTKWQYLSKYEIPLPPLEEQKQIAALFQSIDNAIEQTEAQEKNLTSLLKKLAGDLVCKSAQFGTVLNDNNTQTVILGDIAKESRNSSKSPMEEGIERFVGLEHIEPGNLKIQGWGNVADGTTFTKVFLEGDVLFGRRRAYLKKAARADFKGLCSGDITVLRANKKLVLPELLPYCLSADPVFEFAVVNSAGSLSPRAKWKDLSKYELTLPDFDTQKKILEVFSLLDLNISQHKDQKQTLKKFKQKLLDEILG